MTSIELQDEQKPTLVSYFKIMQYKVNQDGCHNVTLDHSFTASFNMIGDTDPVTIIITFKNLNEEQDDLLKQYDLNLQNNKLASSIYFISIEDEDSKCVYIDTSSHYYFFQKRVVEVEGDLITAKFIAEETSEIVEVQLSIPDASLRRNASYILGIREMKKD